MTTITASTSVVLIDTTTGASPYNVYFPNISTNGRLITVRDNAGYASTGNAIVLTPINGASFSGTNPTISINQPFGFVTLNSQLNGTYNILNTFAFPSGSAAAFVSQVTACNILTSTLQMKDIGNNSTNTFFVSSGSTYINNTLMGQVTTTQLQSTVNGLGTAGYISTLVIPTTTPSIYLAVGQTSNQIAGGTTPTGSIQYSELALSWSNANAGFYSGFSNGANDVTFGGQYAVAVGNQGTTTTANILYSIDGSNWKDATSPSLTTSQIRNRVIYANGLYHAVGPNTGGKAILYSADGISWNDSVTTGLFPGTGGCTGIAYGRGIWVAAGQQTTGVAAQSLLWSSDGSNWNSANLPVVWSGNNVWDVGFDGFNFVALVASSTAGGTNVIKSSDGSNWTAVASPTANFGLGTNPGKIAGFSNFWLATGSNNAAANQMFFYSQDGANTWQSNLSFPGASGSLGRPYYDGSSWYVGFYNPATPSVEGLYYSFNGITGWGNANISNAFVGGFPKALAVVAGSSNLSQQLLSTVAGLQDSFYTSSFSANYAQVANMNVSSLTVSSLLVQVEVISTSVEVINTVSTLISDYASTTQLFANRGVISSIQTNYISSGAIQASTIVSDYASSIRFIANQGTFSSIQTNTISSGAIQASTIVSDYASSIRFIANQGTFSSIQTNNISSGAIQANMISTNIEFASTVGIGTTAPETALMIVLDARSSVSTIGGVYGDYGSNGQLFIATTTTPNKRLALGYNQLDDAGVIQAVHKNINQKPLSLNPSGGNVGIRTINPSYPLDVNDSMSVFYSNSSGLTTRVNTQFSNAANPVVSRQMTSEIQLGSITTGIGSNYNVAIRSMQNTAVDTIDLGFFTNQATNNCNLVERMTIQNRTGYVGINDTTPSFTLDINGESRTYNSKGSYTILDNTYGVALEHSNTNGAGFVQFVNQATAGGVTKDTLTLYAYPATGGNRFVYQISTAGTMYFNSSIGVGIYPTETMDVNGVLNLRGGTVTQDSSSVDASNRSNTYIRFAEAGATSDYAYLRQIGGANAIHLALDFHDDGNDGSFSIRKVQSTAAPDTIATLFTVDSLNNRVGINCNAPLYPLHVNGTIYGQNTVVLGTTPGTPFNLQLDGSDIFGSPVSGRISYGSDNSGYQMRFSKRVGGTYTDIMTLTDNNRVGINTNTPSFPLDVNGVIRGTSNIVRIVNQRFNNSAGSTTVNAGVATNIITLPYTPVQSGNVNILLSCSVSFGIQSGSFSDYCYIKMSNATSELDSYALGLNGGDMISIRGNYLNHKLYGQVVQNGANTYVINFYNGGDDPVSINNITTLTVMELSQT